MPAARAPLNAAAPPRVRIAVAAELPAGVPLAGTLALLLGMAALVTTENSNLKLAAEHASEESQVLRAALPMLAAALLIFAAKASRIRLARNGILAWILRLAMVGGAIFYAVLITRQIQAAYYLHFVARCAGYIFCFEGALQHWLRRPATPDGSAFIVFLAAIVFVLASRTVNPLYIKYFTPPFAVLLVLSMRASRPRDQREERGAPLWIWGLLCGVTLGGGMALAVTANAPVLSRIVSSLLLPRTIEEFSDTNSRPMLSRSLATASSQTRMLKIEGTLAEHHLRGQVFDIYFCNGAWGPATSLKGSHDAALLRALPGGERLNITPLLDSFSVLYVPLHMAGIDAPAYGTQWSRELNGPVFAEQKPAQRAPYEVAIADELHRGPLTDSMSDVLSKACLDLPENLNPGIKALALEIGGTLNDPREKMEAVRKHLWRNHNYSLHIEPGLGDPAANFLLKKLDGHCQYFASATVLLLRELGVPARYVTGFYVHESPKAGEWIVRQRDAHAWVEVWLEGEGWITFDTTPSSGMPGQLGGVSWWSKLLEKLGDWSESVGTWLRDAPLKNLALLSGGAVLAVLLIRYLRRRARRLRALNPLPTYESAGLAFEALAQGFENYLRRRGVPCPSHTPWGNHLAKLKNLPGGGVPAVEIRWDEAEEFSRAYAVARFGAHTDDSGMQHLRELLARLNS